MPLRRPAVGQSRLPATALVLTLIAGACTNGSLESSPPATDLSSAEIILTSGLETVDGCGALLERLKAEAIERVGPYGFDGQFGPFGPMPVDVMVDDSAEAMAADTAGVAEDGGGALRGGGEEEPFSRTNNQEAAVDEADLVKTDGDRLVVVTENEVQVIDVSADDPRLESTIKLPDEISGGELFLNDNSALIMTTGWTETPFLPVAIGIAEDVAWYPGMPTGRLIELDLDERRVVRTLEFEGSYLSAREIDGTIRIALQASANRFAFVLPSNAGAEESAEEFNRRLIENSTIEQWIPTYRITDGREDEVVAGGPIVECDRVHLPAEFAGFGSLVVLTTDLDDGLRLADTVSVFTDAQTVYASTDRLVVATPRWPEFDRDTGEPEIDGSYRTALHTFDISDPDRADYVASGSVFGHLLNQYSLSEYDGHLRVATTAGTPWNTVESESFVTVLDERDRELVEVGRVGGLGRGERIFAVRFLGPLAYVVTFEQIDPLYVVDLSDPERPEVKGELKIPGFSTYLHPLDDGLLLGVGVDGDADGATGGAVVSLFDVSDPSDPVRLDKLALARPAGRYGENGRFGHSFSPVDGDARAFTYWDDTAIIPISWWVSQESRDRFIELGGSDAVLVTVEDDELVERDRVSHPMRRECGGPGGDTVSHIEPDDVEAILTGEIDPIDAGSTVAGGLDPDRDSDNDDNGGG
ncbi:MAG: beta-propeller domain-containing protein, partial [Acidimicrobiia bacterium]|nr:beta-propeller domain-containing protein [Acidimicrobiia bacterium]